MTPALELPTNLNAVALPTELPPLMIVAFTRPELLEVVLEAVAGQTLLPPKILAVLDGSRSAKDKPLIQACVKLFEKFRAIIPVEIVVRPENMGCDRNVVAALTAGFELHPALVYLEDDVVPNPDFYERICRLLAAYRDQPQIFSVSAYASFPTELEAQIEDDFIVSNRVFALGFATWADRWQAIDLAHHPQAYNPFGDFSKIPATLQTQYTLVSQFFLEKNRQTDWVITMTLAVLAQGRVHITPRVSFVRNIGFGHAEAKTYRGSEPAWANAKFDADAQLNRLPSSLQLPKLLANTLPGTKLVQHLEGSQGLWLSPAALGNFLARYPQDAVVFLKFFFGRALVLMRRWRSGLPV
jgi:hypothetical protein